MSREIKFRAWNSFNKEWVYLPESGDIDLIQDYDIIKFDYDKENIILEQWTGLHDKNDKEIYEGDRVLVNGPTNNPKWKGTIEMVDGCWTVVYDEPQQQGNIWRSRDYVKVFVVNHAIEVIGNRHETP